MAIAPSIIEHGLQLVVRKALDIGNSIASQDADLDALRAELKHGGTVLKVFHDKIPEQSLSDLGASLTNALEHGTELYEEARAALEKYNAGVVALGALKCFTGNYGPRLRECKENIEKGVMSVNEHMSHLIALEAGVYGGFEIGQKVDAWRNNGFWSAVSISDIKDKMATVVGNDCDGARFMKKLPLHSHYLRPSDWATPQALFLPLRVLVADPSEPNVWRVTDDGSKSTENGAAYRRSKNFEDDAIAKGCCANRGDLLVGVNQGDDWVQCWPKVRQIVELKNQDDYDAVYLHLSNSQGSTSVSLHNGTQLEVFGQYDGDTFMVEYKGNGYGVKMRHCKRLSNLPQAEKASSKPATGPSS